MATRRVRVLINPKSGVLRAGASTQRVLQEHWDVDGVDLSFQFSRDPQDGQAKARRAVEDGVDSVLVVGGDGMVNTIGGALMGTGVALGVIPAGSGNGFARHFGIPLLAAEAARVLARADRIRIDVGLANGRPFLVTCSMAWDASLVRQFEKSPVRGVLPYVFAGAYELIEYQPQPFSVILDDSRFLNFPEPLVFTVANLTQFGGGCQIAPSARPDDGMLELVTINRQDLPGVLARLPKVFQGGIESIPGVQTHRFRSLRVRRLRAAPLQVDGEVAGDAAEVSIDVQPRALEVLVPPERY